VFEGPPGAEKAVRYAGTIQDITAQKMAERNQQIMVAELNHRVKNVLAIVQSLAFQTLRGSAVPEEVAETFSGRLQALASAHDLLTEEKWEGANIRGIALGALEPLAPDVSRRIAIEGEDLQLNPQVAVSLSMALHELATNAAKYGALSNHQGRVELSWRVVAHSDPRLHIDWRERGGPTVTAPDHNGFGTRMISRVIGSNMNGKVDLSFDPEGVHCAIDAPLEGVIRASGASTTSAQAVELTQ
jgi:two-component sensor histidine kinase